MTEYTLILITIYFQEKEESKSIPWDTYILVSKDK